MPNDLRSFQNQQGAASTVQPNLEDQDALRWWMREPASQSHLQDLVEAVVLLHDLLLLRVQDGAADQQVEVLTGEIGPHHLRMRRRGGVRQGKATPPPDVGRAAGETHFPEPQHVHEAELPLEPDQQPAEAEVQVARVLRLWRGNKAKSEEARGATAGQSLGQGLHTEVVPEGQVKQPEESAELDQLGLHPLHLLLKVLVLCAHTHTVHTHTGWRRPVTHCKRLPSASRHSPSGP